MKKYTFSKGEQELFVCEEEEDQEASGRFHLFLKEHDIDVDTTTVTVLAERVKLGD